MEITAEDVNKLIVNTDDIPVRKPKVRSEKQKENDIKLKERLIEYHRKKKELKNNAVEIALKHINDSFKELEEMKEEMKGAEPISIIEVSKIKRGRPKKVVKEFPATECVSCSV